MNDRHELTAEELTALRGLRGAPLPDADEESIRQLAHPERKAETADILGASRTVMEDAAVCAVVPDTSVFPFAAVACLRINLAANPARRGTAFFINDHVLLTAGHNVEIVGDTVTSIDVMPALNGRGFAVNTTLFEPAANYRRHHVPAFDYGAIFVRGGLSPVHFGLRVPDDASLNGLPVRLQGYPSADLLQRDCHGNVGPIGPVLFGYDIPTHEGESGGPVWFVEDRHAIVVGIHIGEIRGQPAARRFTPDSATEIRAWAAVGG